MGKDTTELRRIQLLELDLLKKVKQICEKYGLVYYLDSGTLLGAVRHKGFIPWDDDIDITMPYKDYCIFLTLAQKELGDKFFVQNFNTEDGFNRGFTKIRINNTTYVSTENLDSHIHQGIWIDIFPLIFVGSKVEYNIDRFLIKISNVVQIQDYIRYAKPDFIKRFGKRGTCMLELFNRLPLSMRKGMHSTLIRCCSCSFGKKYVTYIWDTIGKLTPSDCFLEKKRYMMFEDEEFRIPYKTEKYLTLLYGNFLELPPVEERCGHPFRLLDFEKDVLNSKVVKRHMKNNK